MFSGSVFKPKYFSHFKTFSLKNSNLACYGTHLALGKVNLYPNFIKHVLKESELSCEV